MTERDLIKRQRNDEVRYIMQVGLFWHAYEESAFALARITGYSVRRVVRRDNAVVYLLGFPASSLEHVREQLLDNNIRLEMVKGETNLLCFKGGCGTFDETLVSETKSSKSEKSRQGEKKSDGEMVDEDLCQSVSDQIFEAVRNFDLLNATPVDTFLFVTQLKRILSKVVVVVALMLCSTPVLAQSGIDSLKSGGSLGGDTPPGGTGVERIVVDSSAQPHAKGSQPAYFALDGRRIDAPRRGEAYIIRWREQGTWRTRKTVGR